MGKVITLIAFAMLVSFNLYSFETIMRIRKDIALILKRLPPVGEGGARAQGNQPKKAEEVDLGTTKPMIVKGITDVFKKVAKQVVV
jgi:hypothetical protein